MVTLALIAANVAIFLLMGVRTGEWDFSGRELVDWGGNLGELSLHSEPWRLVSEMYLHANLTHIVSNMLLLLITGLLVENAIGSARAFVVYTFCGVCGALLSAVAHPDVVGVGASGAIAGLLGALVVLYLAHRSPAMSGGWLLRVIGLNAIGSFASGVDGFAHLGGFVAGLASGGALLLLGHTAQDRQRSPET